MKGKWGLLFGLFFFLLGAGALALTAYLWLGDWPSRTREIVAHYRSLAEKAGEPTAPLLAHVYGRDFVSLAGEWPAVVDPYRRGDLGGIAARAAEPRTASDLSEFPFENGLVLSVPGDWNTQDPRLYFYQGVVFYKTEFEHSAEPCQRSFLWFGAANYRASVYLNGLMVGAHEGGFTPFNIELTGVLQPGPNLLVVRVDNEKGDDDVPTPTTDWHNYGGLTRDVLLIDVPETFIRDYEIRLAPDSSGRIEGWVQLDGPEPERAIRIEISELGVEI